MPKSDFHVADHGSLMLLYPISHLAEEWVEEHVGGEETQHWGEAVVVEPRYIGPIVEAMLAEGLEMA